MFPVWPDRKRSREFYRVHVFVTRDEMLKRGLEVAGLSGEYQAFCFSDLSARRGNCVGVVCFYLDNVTEHIVAHEMAHAALYWLVMHQGIRPACPCRGISAEDSFDERNARAIESLVRQFWRNFGEQRVRRAA